MRVQLNRLNEAIVSSGKSTKQIADAIGVDAYLVTEWREGYRPVPVALVNILAGAIGTTREFLVSGGERWVPLGEWTSEDLVKMNSHHPNAAASALPKSGSDSQPMVAAIRSTSLTASARQSRISRPVRTSVTLPGHDPDD